MPCSLRQQGPPKRCYLSTWMASPIPDGSNLHRPHTVATVDYNAISNKLQTYLILSLALCFSLSNGATARGGPRPPSRVSSILPGLGRLFSNFYTLALLRLPPLHLPNAAWVSLWRAFLLAHWEGLSGINHRRPGVWHVLPISDY